MELSLNGIRGAFQELAPWKSASHRRADAMVGRGGLAQSKTLRERHNLLVSFTAAVPLASGSGIHPAATFIKLFFALFAMISIALSAAANIDLLQKYPTSLTAGDTDGEKARPWDFSSTDIYRVSRFNLQVAEELKIDVGPADLAIGHCVDGAIWAIVIPRHSGALTSKALKSSESVAHVWLRFHPAEIARLFPADTVFADGAKNIISQVRRIANLKMDSSWQAGGRALIPERKDMSVDIDTKGNVRRFFMVDTAAKTAEYVRVFEREAVPLPQAMAADVAQAAFDQLWEAFDKEYAMFVLRPEVNWSQLRDEYRPKAIASKDTQEFAGICAEMLKPLRDLHVWFTVGDEHVPIFNRPRAANANPGARQKILGNLYEDQHGVDWTVTEDKIGFIGIQGWDDAAVPTECQTALEHMRDTRGLIVDVRLNGGGSENQAMEFAGRFLTNEFVYAYHRTRNGPAHTNLTDKVPRTISPRGPWRFDRPVVLLIGQKCMSSTESFIGMMTGDPDLVTMGDHTCGSSGNPDIINLPLQMTVSVPQWIDHLPDGSVLDERGFTPQVPFVPKADAFTGDRDDLLSAALERLRKSPLPARPIEGPAYHSQAEDPAAPKVVSVFPPDGAQAVDPVTELRVQFDQPMDPLSLKLSWKSSGFLDSDFPEYDPDKYEFRMAVHLAPGKSHRIVLNEPMMPGDPAKARAQFPRDGFMSSDHHLAGLFTWAFQAKAAAPASGNPPEVLKISPSPGSRVPYRTFLEVQFDQPMQPPAESLPYLVFKNGSPEWPSLVCHVEYDAASHTFRLPLLLPTKEKVPLTVSNLTTQIAALFAPPKQEIFTLAGFRSATGVAAAPIKLNFQVSNAELSRSDRAKFDAAAKDPRLLKALDSMKQKRAGVTSLAERIQMLMLSGGDGMFTRFEAQGASFKWQKPDLLYADGANIMRGCAAFEIGSDGQNWWHHNESASFAKLIVCPAKEMQQRHIIICDPFRLAQQSSAQAASKMNLSWVGNTTLHGLNCWLLEGWDIYLAPGTATGGSLNRWWIDEQTGRPLELTGYSDNIQMRTRFLYDKVNEPLPIEDFAVPKIDGLAPSPADMLDMNYTNHYVTIDDGSDAHSSMQWGKIGPRGTADDGYN
jgi:hypothetical protein